MIIWDSDKRCRGKIPGNGSQSDRAWWAAFNWVVLEGGSLSQGSESWDLLEEDTGGCRSQAEALQACLHARHQDRIQGGKDQRDSEKGIL